MKKRIRQFGLRKSSLFLLGLVAVFSLFGNSARAVDTIDVEYPVGSNLNGGSIYNETNILPGWEGSETIRVENDSENEAVDVYFTFDVNGDKTLADELKLYVVRVENGSYRIGGEGDRYTLKEADDKRLYVDRLSATKGKQYRIKIKFNEDAGNEFQGLETDFDIDFRIESESATTQTEEEILAGEGRVVTGNEPTEGSGEKPEVQGEQEGGAGDVTVGGVESQCQWWPLWVWILALVVFSILFLTSLFYKFKEQKENDYPRRFAPLTLTVVVLAFWYFFDKCDEHRWFAITSIIGAVVVYLVYLYLLKNMDSSSLKMEGEDLEIKSEEVIENKAKDNSEK